ncbi:MAG: holliday junction helicase RuvA [Candidatus Peribacteria bacterium]|nr:holliday junction helicase RuvA [Candidatus Peribacteria bacterium]
MIAHLRGSIHKLNPGEATVDVQGVGYRVSIPLDAWDTLEEGTQHMLWISTYLREDRLDLYGFPDRAGRTLFEELIKKQGIGPRLALELCAVPRNLLVQAVAEQDERLLTSIKGIGKKTAEKLLIDFKGMMEKDPDIFGPMHEAGTPVRNEFDRDAISALTSLGYDTQTVMHALKELPADLQTTEDRVAAALRSL